MFIRWASHRIMFFFYDIYIYTYIYIYIINSPNRACSKGSWRREKEIPIVLPGRVSKSAGCISCKDLLHFLHSGVKNVQIMQGFIGCRKVPPHFVQGFILFFALGWVPVGTVSGLPPAGLPARIWGATMSIFHKENVYFQHSILQNVIIT